MLLTGRKPLLSAPEELRRAVGVADAAESGARAPAAVGVGHSGLTSSVTPPRVGRKPRGERYGFYPATLHRHGSRVCVPFRGTVAPLLDWIPRHGTNAHLFSRFLLHKG